MQAVNGTHIIVDSREKRPYHFAGSVSGTLSVGDYSIEGYEDKLALERKGFDDLFNSLTTGNARFTKQLKRLGELEQGALIIDSSPDAIRIGHFRCKLPGNLALNRILQKCMHAGVPVIFAGKQGPLLAGMWLAAAVRECNHCG